ncbi:MAG: hypothetical protein CMM93_08630 [Rickettsiales bacterium]|nr:hypothetical protein [Rickettsiales bacterium]
MKTNKFYFATGIDTKKFIVPIHTKIRVRDSYLNKEGKSRLYLHITGDGERKRLSLDLYVDPNVFDAKKQLLRGSSAEIVQDNLVIDNYKAKATSIKTAFYLTNKTLTVDKFVDEFINGVPRTNFLAFCTHFLEHNKTNYAPGTYRRYKSLIAKISRYKKRIDFADLTYSEIQKIRNYLFKEGNASTTVETAIQGVKMFLNAAKKSGINLALDTEDIKVGNTNGRRIDLSIEEVKKLKAFYFSEYINKSYRIVLGYFLFSCKTGLRISEIQSISREDFVNGCFEYHEQKKKRYRSKPITEGLSEIINGDSDLFVKKFTNEYINRELKKIVRACGINKKVSFHTARHTFATNFIRLGGHVKDLQNHLGHSKLSQTMKYSHRVEEESNKTLSIMDTI